MGTDSGPLYVDESTASRWCPIRRIKSRKVLAKDFQKVPLGDATVQVFEQKTK